MRIAMLALALGGVLSLAPSTQAGQEIMAPWVNYHKPFVIYPRAECWGPYGIAGMTDTVPCQPVNGIGPPPFGPRWWYQQQSAAPAHNPWGPWRSPRDYFMTCPY